MEDFWIFPVVIALTIAVAVGCAAWTGTAVAAWQCAKYQEVTGRKTMAAGLDCYVQEGGHWYAWGEYKYRLAGPRK